MARRARSPSIAVARSGRYSTAMSATGSPLELRGLRSSIAAPICCKRIEQPGSRWIYAGIADDDRASGRDCRRRHEEGRRREIARDLNRVGLQRPGSETDGTPVPFDLRTEIGKEPFGVVARATIAVHPHRNSREQTGEEQRGFYLSRRRKQNKVARLDLRRALELQLEGIRQSSRSLRRRREVAPRPAPSGGAAATRRRQIEPRCRLRRRRPGASGPSTLSSCSQACAAGPRAMPGARRVRRRRSRSALPARRARRAWPRRRGLDSDWRPQAARCSERRR